MDRYSSSSSSHSRHHHHSSSSSSSKHRDRDDRKRKKSRSRSRSPRYSSSYSRHEKTRREYEIEVEALQEENRELRAQLEHFRAQITSVSLAQVQADSRAAHWEHEANRINTSYQECTKVLMALRQGVDNLEREKQRYIDEASKAQKERDIADLTTSNYRQQIEEAQVRNIALVKKCETFVDENKSLKDKVASQEEELKELRPALGKLETELDKSQKDNKQYHEENAILREKEKAWIAEKKDFEKKLLIKEALFAAERKNTNNSVKKVDGRTSDIKEDGIEMERIKKLELVIDSLHSHYEARLKQLEDMLMEIAVEEEQNDTMTETSDIQENDTLHRNGGVEGGRMSNAELLSPQLNEAANAILTSIETNEEESMNGKITTESHTRD